MSDIVFDNNGEPLGTFEDGVIWATEMWASCLGVPSESISWDAATETYDGDVAAVLHGIMASAFGDEWSNNLHPRPLAKNGTTTP